MEHVRSILSWILTSVVTLGVAAGVVLVDRGPQVPTSFVASETTVPHSAAVRGTVHHRAAVAHQSAAPIVKVTKKVHVKVSRVAPTTTTVAPTTTTTVPPTTTTTVPPTTTTTVLTVINVTTTTVHHGGGDDGGGGGGGGGGTTSTTIDN